LRRRGFNDDAIGVNIGPGLVIEILHQCGSGVPRRMAAQPFAAGIVRRHGPPLSQRERLALATPQYRATSPAGAVGRDDQAK
jgi:hypothetical protein